MSPNHQLVVEKSAATATFILSFRCIPPPTCKEITSGRRVVCPTMLFCTENTDCIMSSCACATYKKYDTVVNGRSSYLQQAHSAYDQATALCLKHLPVRRVEFCQRATDFVAGLLHRNRVPIAPNPPLLESFVDRLVAITCVGEDNNRVHFKAVPSLEKLAADVWIVGYRNIE